MMTQEERGHIRHSATIARAARRDLWIGGAPADITVEIAKVIKTLEEIENSARHALLSGTGEG